MGVKTSPSVFSRLIDMVLAGMQHEIFAYLDDIIVYAKNLKDHNRKCRMLLDRLRSAKLLLDPRKCFFLKQETEFLGHKIGNNQLKPSDKKVAAVKNFPVPTNQKKAKIF